LVAEYPMCSSGLNAQAEPDTIRIAKIIAVIFAFIVVLLNVFLNFCSLVVFYV